MDLVVLANSAAYLLGFEHFTTDYKTAKTSLLLLPLLLSLLLYVGREAEETAEAAEAVKEGSGK